MQDTTENKVSINIDQTVTKIHLDTKKPRTISVIYKDKRNNELIRNLIITSKGRILLV